LELQFNKPLTEDISFQHLHHRLEMVVVRLSNKNRLRRHSLLIFHFPHPIWQKAWQGSRRIRKRGHSYY